MQECSKCEWRRSKMNKTPGKKIPGGTGKCTRPEGPCEEYIPAGNIGEIAETGQRKPVVRQPHACDPNQFGVFTKTDDTVISGKDFEVILSVVFDGKYWRHCVSADWGGVSDLAGGLSAKPDVKSPQALTRYQALQQAWLDVLKRLAESRGDEPNKYIDAAIAAVKAFVIERPEQDDEPEPATLEPHPYADLFPMLPAADLEKLAASIAADGQQQPIVILDGKILDGRNRYAACQLAGVDPKTVEYEGADPLGFVIALNLTRRHLNESQRAMAAARVAKIKHGGDRKSDQSANLRLESRSQDEAAEMFGVSRRSVQSAKAVIDKGAPEIAKVIDAGDLSVSVASTLTSLSKDDQSDFAKQGPAFLRKAAAQIRKDARAGKEIEDEPEDPKAAIKHGFQKVIERNGDGFDLTDLIAALNDVWFEIHPIE